MQAYEWISNFITHIKMDIITDPCWDYSYSKLVKYAKDVINKVGGRAMCLSLSMPHRAVFIMYFSGSTPFCSPISSTKCLGQLSAPHWVSFPPTSRNRMNCRRANVIIAQKHILLFHPIFYFNFLKIYQYVLLSTKLVFYIDLHINTICHQVGQWHYHTYHS